MVRFHKTQMIAIIIQQIVTMSIYGQEGLLRRTFENPREWFAEIAQFLVDTNYPP